MVFLTVIFCLLVSFFFGSAPAGGFTANCCAFSSESLHDVRYSSFSRLLKKSHINWAKVRKSSMNKNYFSGLFFNLAITFVLGGILNTGNNCHIFRVNLIGCFGSSFALCFRHEKWGGVPWLFWPSASLLQQMLNLENHQNVHRSLCHLKWWLVSPSLISCLILIKIQFHDIPTLHQLTCLTVNPAHLCWRTASIHVDQIHLANQSTMKTKVWDIIMNWLYKMWVKLC